MEVRRKVRLDYMLKGLNHYLPRDCPPLNEIFSPEHIEMLDNQKLLCADRLYLGDGRSAELLREASAEPDSIVLLSDHAAAEVPDGAFVLSLSCSLPTLFNCLSSALIQEARAKAAGHQTFQQCWESIAAHRITSTGQIREALNKLPNPVGQFVQLAVLTAAHSSVGVNHGALLAELESIFPATNMAVHQNNVILLFSYEERTSSWDFPRNNDLQALLEKYDTYLAVSNSTRNLSALYLLYILTKGVPGLACQLNLEKNKRIFLYERYSIYISIDLCVQRFVELYGVDDIIYLVHPAVIHLTRYDREHHTDLRRFLYHYLLNDRNLVKTSSELYMHRNTVVNKVRRISELIALDLNDGALRHRLIFSCQVILYYEKIMRLPLKL